MKTSLSIANGSLMPFDFQHCFNEFREFCESHSKSNGEYREEKEHGNMSCDSILDFIDTVLEILDQTQCITEGIRGEKTMTCYVQKGKQAESTL